MNPFLLYFIFVILAGMIYFLWKIKKNFKLNKKLKIDYWMISFGLLALIVVIFGLVTILHKVSTMSDAEIESNVEKLSVVKSNSQVNLSDDELMLETVLDAMPTLMWMIMLLPLVMVLMRIFA